MTDLVDGVACLHAVTGAVRATRFLRKSAGAGNERRRRTPSLRGKLLQLGANAARITFAHLSAPVRWITLRTQFDASRGRENFDVWCGAATDRTPPEKDAGMNPP
jgi:hypothetical protein